MIIGKRLTARRLRNELGNRLAIGVITSPRRFIFVSRTRRALEQYGSACAPRAAPHVTPHGDLIANDSLHWPNELIVIIIINRSTSAELRR